MYHKEYYQKCVHFLANQNGIKQCEQILKLDRSEVLKLTNPCVFIIDEKEVAFKSLTQEQIDAVLKVFDGKINLKFINESYYLNAYSKNNPKSIYEQASNQDKNKRVKFIMLIGYRMILTLMLGLIFAGLQIDKSNGADTGQIAINLATRMMTLCSAITWGFFTANEMVKDDCIFLAYKSRILETFWIEVEVDKSFVVKSIEEKAKEEYEAFMKIKSKGDEVDGRERKEETTEENQDIHS